MSNTGSNFNKKRLRSSNITVVISITLVLFLIGITGLILINVQNYSNYLKDKYVVEVFLNDFVDKKDSAQVYKLQLEYKEELQKKPFVKTVRFIDKKEAFELAKIDLGPDKVRMLEENIFPASVQVTLNSKYVNEDSVKVISKELGLYDVVDEVKKDDSLMREVYEKINEIMVWVIAIAILFLIIAIVLINNSIRLRIFSKRFLIKTMQLVGAKKSFILMPFIRQSFVLGLIGSVIALLLLGTLWYYFTTNIDMPFIEDTSKYIILAILILVIGILISVLSTIFATSKFIRLKVDDLYYS